MLTLVCPQCQASYQLPLASFGQSGKKVRCASCGHTWVALDPPDETPVESISVRQVATQAQGIRISAENDFAPRSNFSANPFAEAVAEATANPRPPKMIGAKRLDHAQKQLIQQEKEYSLLKWARLLSFTTAMIWMLLLAAGNQWIVTKIPQALPIYYAIGADPLPAGSGFQFVNVKDDSAIDSDDKILRISGEIENMTPQPRQVPMLVLHITAPDGQTKQFVHNLHNQMIGPGQRAAFLIERPHFAESGWEIALKFQ